MRYIRILIMQAFFCLQDERFAYCNRVRRSIVEVLYEFRETTPNIPVNYILDLIPVLQPRAFSIASAQCVSI